MPPDTMEREGVNTVSEALTVPHNPSIERQVRRFGFEYEMLPTTGDDYDEDYSEDDRVEDHMDDYEPWDDDHQQCNCDECLNERRDEERRRYTRTLTPQTGRGTPYDLIERAYNLGMIEDTDKHAYHCNCSTCSHTRTHPLMTAQSDCSCGVEFVSRIIDLDHFSQAKYDMTEWVGMMNKWKNDGLWMPDGNYANGNHVHVSADGDTCTWQGNQRPEAFTHIDALYAAFDWTGIADGGCGRIRSYNAKPSITGGHGSWLSDRGYGTFEHRLWNTPAIPERLWAHVGISIGIQRWGFALATANPGFTFWTGTNHNSYGYTRRSISDETYNVLTDNVDGIVEGIRSYIPTDTQFTIARDLISNLTPA